MIDINAYIKSGIVEAYVLGLATIEEMQEMEALMTNHPKIKLAIDEFSDEVEQIAMANVVAPNPTIKPFLMATIDFTERMQNGETPSIAPHLHEHSTIDDYSQWLSRPDMFLPENFTDSYAKIISFTPEAITAIVWIKDGAPQEVHHNEYEKFLIVEGSCDITIGEKVHQLSPGSVLSIPLYETHSVKITSSIPCKIILQRVAA